MYRQHKAKTFSNESARVVILGAGASGIAAATRLLENGFKNVLVLEAEERIGGRVHTIPFADSVVDLGAQWCHGEDGNVVYQQVKDLNVLSSSGDLYEQYRCIRSNGEVVDKELSDTLKSIAFGLAAECEADEAKYFGGSLGALITERFWAAIKQMQPKPNPEITHEFFTNFEKFASSYVAADNLHEVSAKGALDYVDCGGDLHLDWRDKGFHTYLQVLLRAHGNDNSDLGILEKRVLFKKRVTNINWQHSGEVKLRCSDGTSFSADHVIITVSLGVLQSQHEKLFTPALPLSKRRAIESYKLGAVEKFFLEFETPCWPENWQGMYLLWTEHDLNELRNSKYFWLENVFGLFRVSCQPRLMQGWIIGDHARHMAKLPEPEVLKAILWLLRKFLTKPVPDPVRFLRTQWTSNPNFRGSYSFPTVLTIKYGTTAADIAKPLTDDEGIPRVQFAGEATNRIHFGTVHGAVDTGYREAELLIETYKKCDKFRVVRNKL